jgi:hypothetical protein
VVGAGVEVGVDAERDRGAGVAELARDKDDVQPVGDQDGRLASGGPTSFVIAVIVR